MKKYLTIISILITFISFGQNCSMLKNGKYQIEYDALDRKHDSFEKIENYYYTYENGVRKEFDIIALSDCSFKLKSKEKIDDSKLSEFQKQIVKQEAYFEITKVKGNIYYFICRVNLHIQCGSGKFVRENP